MPTDKYSDDHTIIVNGGTGTLTLQGDLIVTGAVGSSGDTIVTGDAFSVNTGPIELVSSETIDIDAIEDISITTDNNITLDAGGITNILSDTDINITGGLGAGTRKVSISAGSSDNNSIVISKGTNSILVKSGVSTTVDSPGSGDFYLYASDDIRIYGGVGGTSGEIMISPNNGVTTSPYIHLLENGNLLNISASGIGITSTGNTTISGSSVTIQTSSAQTNEFTLPGSSLILSDEFGTPSESDKTTELESDESIVRTLSGNIKWTQNRMGDPDPEDRIKTRIYLTAPLPESIPNGATITGLGYMINRTAGNAARTVEIWLVRTNYSTGEVTATTYGFTNMSGDLAGLGFVYENKTDVSTPITINRSSYGYSIRIRLILEHISGDEEINYFLGSRVIYTTNKYDLNS